jgi:outer membrane immunogenic protein
VDAGSQTVVNSASFDPNANFRNRFHLFRKGLNYRFGGSAPALPAHNWSGFYAGWNAGVGVSHVHADSTVVSGVADIADAAFTGGLQAGYNWQLAPHWVAGVEADINWLGVDRTYSEWVNSIVFGVKADWYSTLRVRLAYSAGPALLYVTGGAAVVNVKNVFDQVITSTNARSETAFGWTIGGGIEAALGNNWTAKSEYLYIDAGNQAVPAPSIGALVVGDFDNRFHVFRFGLNYRFATGKAPGPVVTKY